MNTKLAEQFEENEQYDKAYEEYKKLYSQNSKDVDLLSRLAHVAVILEKNEEAAQYYTQILNLDPANEMAHEQLMDVYFHTDRYRYYVARGNLHLLHQEFSHALNDFKKAIDKAETAQQISTSRFIVAGLYAQLGKPHKAIDEYLRVIESEVADEIVYMQLAQLYVDQDMLSSAIDTLEKAKEHGFDSDNINESLAQLHLRVGNAKTARELTKDELVVARGFLDEEKNEKAFEILEKNKEKYSMNSEYKLLMAKYYYNVKNWEKALSWVDEYSKAEPGSALSHQMKAFIYEEMGQEFDAHVCWAKYGIIRKDKDVALNEYMNAYQLRDDDAQLLKNIAELHEELGGKLHAIEFWEKLAVVDDTNTKALEKLADFRKEIGDYRAQIDALEKLLAADKRNSVAVKSLAEAYEKVKNKDKALEYYNKFVSISPLNDESEQVKQKIKKLESTEMVEEEGLIDKFMRLFIKK